MLFESIGEEWTWTADAVNDNRIRVSRIFKDLKGVSVFNKADWPSIISFFKPRIVALDAFWSNARYSFELLR
jgi:hypothetical protein